jgi:hypothetical protein
LIEELHADSEVAEAYTTVRRDPERLLAPTKAYDAQRLTGEHLDEAERRRTSQGAHSRNIAMSGRDLKYVGRAIPAWRKMGT